MNFISALNKAKEEGISIVPTRYSEDAKRKVQYYFDCKGNFVSQEGNGLPKNPNLSGETHIVEEWEVYCGDFEQTRGRDSEKFQRYLELKNKYGGLFDEIEEFKNFCKIFK